MGEPLTSAGVAARARRRRIEAAERYRPERVDTLLVTEAPPTALDRFFYFEDVQTQDSLFRHVAEMVLGEKPTRDKAPFLDALSERGYFLIDVSEDPIASRREDLPRCIPDLIERCRELEPNRIVLIAVGVYDLAFQPLRDAGLPVVNARIPFPGTGQQTNFKEVFAELVGGPEGARPRRAVN